MIASIGYISECSVIPANAPANMLTARELDGISSYSISNSSPIVLTSKMKVWGTFVAVVEKIPVLAVAAIVVWSYVVFVSKILVTFDLAPAGITTT